MTKTRVRWIIRTSSSFFVGDVLIGLGRRLERDWMRDPEDTWARVECPNGLFGFVKSIYLLRGLEKF